MAPQGGDGAQPEGPGSENDDPLARHHLAGEGGVGRTGGGLDHHGRLVAHLVGDQVELRLVRHELVGPSAPGVGAVARLQSWPDVAEGDALANSGAPVGA